MPDAGFDKYRFQIYNGDGSINVATVCFILAIVIILIALAVLAWRIYYEFYQKPRKPKKEKIRVMPAQPQKLNPAALKTYTIDNAKREETSAGAFELGESSTNGEIATNADSRVRLSSISSKRSKNSVSHISVDVTMEPSDSRDSRKTSVSEVEVHQTDNATLSSLKPKKTLVSELQKHEDETSQSSSKVSKVTFSISSSSPKRPRSVKKRYRKKNGTQPLETFKKLEDNSNLPNGGANRTPSDGNTSLDVKVEIDSSTDDNNISTYDLEAARRRQDLARKRHKFRKQKALIERGMESNILSAFRMHHS